MRNMTKLICVAAFFVLSLAACTFGDKGDEGRTDSAAVDTMQKTHEEAGHRGTGIDQDTAVHSKETSILKDTMGTDSMGRSKKP
jgi:hypothetical protein